MKLCIYGSPKWFFFIIVILVGSLFYVNYVLFIQKQSTSAAAGSSADLRRYPQSGWSYLLDQVKKLDILADQKIEQQHMNRIDDHDYKRDANDEDDRKLHPPSEISLFRLAIEDTPLLQEVTDNKARVHDLFSVSFVDSRVRFHGLSDAQQSTVRSTIEPYKHWSHDTGETYPSFESMIDVSQPPLNWSQCHTRENRVIFLLSPWHTDNTFHLHNDNLLTVFANLYAASSSADPHRLANIDHVIYPIDTKHPSFHPFAHNQTILYYFRDPNTKPQRYWSIFQKMFDSNVYPLDTLNDGRIYCFEHLRWGRGPLLDYLKANAQLPTPTSSAPSDNPHAISGRFGYWTYTAQFYRQFVLNLYDIPTRTVNRKRPSLPLVTMLTRSSEGGRWMPNRHLLTEAFAKAGVSMQLCCDWSTVSLEAIFRTIQATDIMIGVHGAALTHGAYLPSNAMLVDLQTHYTFENFHDVVFLQVAAHANATFMSFDIRPLAGTDGYMATPNWSDDTVNSILQRWYQ